MSASLHQILLFVTIATCFPLDYLNATGNVLVPRQCVWDTAKNDWKCNARLPTVAEFVDRMRDGANGGKALPKARALFYTNLLSLSEMRDSDKVNEAYQWCVAWLKGRAIDDYFSYFESLDVNWQNAQDEHINTNIDLFAKTYGSREQVAFLYGSCYSQALAAATQHPEVYLFTKKGEDWRPNSGWQLAEQWLLTQTGSAVRRIWRVDPRPCPDGEGLKAEPEILWDVVRDKPLKEEWKCPVTGQ